MNTAHYQDEVIELYELFFLGLLFIILPMKVVLGMCRIVMLLL